MKKSALRTTNGQASLQVEGIGDIGKCSDVKFCPGASTDLISVSKMKAIGFKISFGDEKGPVFIRHRATNEICCVGVEVNELFLITVEDFLNLVYRDGRSMEVETNRRYAGLCYDLGCEDYKIFRHETRGNYCDFLKEAFDMDVLVDERTLPVELPNVVWNGEADFEHECTMECLLAMPCILWMMLQIIG